MGRRKKTGEVDSQNSAFSFTEAPEARPAADTLREEAEERVRIEKKPEPAGAAAPEFFSQVLQELRVHQIELEMQNEELRRAQIELDIARSRYFDLYDLAPVGYCTLNNAGAIVQANLTAVTMLGLSRSATIGRAFARFVEPQDQRVLHTLLKQVMTTGERQTAEVRMVRYDGTLFWAQLIGVTGLDEGGVAERRIVMSDITDRRKAETGHRETETRYRELFSRAVDGIVVCDAQGVIEDANEAFCLMHGWSRDELAGQSLGNLDFHLAALAPGRMGKMLNGQTSTFQVEHRHRDGQALKLEASTSLIFVASTPRLLGYYRLRSSGS